MKTTLSLLCVAVAIASVACSDSPADSLNPDFDEASETGDVEAPEEQELAATALEASIEGLDPIRTADVGIGNIERGADGVNEAASLNIGWVRQTFHWGAFEPSEGRFNFSGTDNYIRAANEKHVKVLAIIAYAPQWARKDPTCTVNCAPANDQEAEFGRAAGAFAEHYNCRDGHLCVDAIEIWNEPNGRNFYRPASDAAQYARLVKQAYPRIKAVSSATVVAGVTSTTGMIPPCEFLKTMYANGAAGNFDAYSHHPYVYADRRTHTVGFDLERSSSWALMFTDMSQAPNTRCSGDETLAEIMRRNGDGAKNIWITETGSNYKGTIAGAAMTEDVQRSVLKNVFQSWNNLRKNGKHAGVLTWFSYTDTDEGMDVKGIRNEAVSAAPSCADGSLNAAPRGSARKAFCTFKNFPRQENPPVASGTGLRGSYFQDMRFTDLVSRRIDPVVDFTRIGTPPVAGVSPTTFSVRWEGFVRAPTSESYTFTTTSDDGVDVWLDGKSIIHDPNNHSPKDNRSAPIVLEAGSRHRITVQYFQNQGGAVMKFAWSTPTRPQTIVPKAALYPIE